MAARSIYGYAGDFGPDTAIRDLQLIRKLGKSLERGGNPSQRGGNPSQGCGNPSEGGGYPSQGGGNPSQGGGKCLERHMRPISKPEIGCWVQIHSVTAVFAIFTLSQGNARMRNVNTTSCARKLGHFGIIT